MSVGAHSATFFWVTRVRVNKVIVPMAHAGESEQTWSIIISLLRILANYELKIIPP